MSARFSCDSFAQIDWSQYQQNLHQTVRQEINDQTKEYVLGVDENDYKSCLVKQYTLESLEIFSDSEQITHRTEKERFQDRFHHVGYRDVYVFRVRYNFRGSPGLFQVKPNPWTMATYPISVDLETVSFELSMGNKDAAEFKRRKEEAFGDSF